MGQSFRLTDCVAATLVVSLLGFVGVTSFQGAAAQAARLTDVDHLRVCMQDFAVWSADHDDSMPNMGLPGDPASAAAYETENVPSQQCMYFSQTRTWPQLLGTQLGVYKREWHSTLGYDDLDGQINMAKYGDEQTRTRYLPTLYRYSKTMLTSPGMWPGAPGEQILNVTQQAQHYAVVRRAQIAFPDRKGVLLHRSLIAEPERWQVAFADGSASDRSPDDAFPAAVLATSRTAERGVPVLETVNGYLGIDF